MQVRFSSCIGIEVITDSSGEVLGNVMDFFIDPDSGKVEGLFVYVPHLMQQRMLLLLTADILRWGQSVSVRSVDVLGPPDDFLRYQKLLEDPRTLIGQRIVTQSGKYIGRCKDVQINTDSMQCEWLFPKKWWKWRIAFPISEVHEVTEKAIILKDPTQFEKEKPETEYEELFDSIPEAPRATRSKQ